MSKFSVKKPMTVFVAVVLIIILGVISFTHMSTDLLPDMELPYVVVMTTYPGATPEKVELTVTKPLEQSLATTSGIKNITSISAENSSIIILEFSASTNMDSAIIEMNSKIDMVTGYFDDTVTAPMLMKLNPDMLPVMIASIDVNGMNTAQISEYAQNDVIPEIERINGVASVSPTGLIENTVKITLNQDKIDRLNDIMTASVDEQLAEAQKQLRSARAQVESGRSQLNTQLAAGADKLSAGSTSLTNGISMLNSLLAEETTLSAQDKAFEAERAGYSSAAQSYNDLNAAFAAIKPVFEGSAISSVNASLASLSSEQRLLLGLPDSVASYSDAYSLFSVLAAAGMPAPNLPSQVPGDISSAIALSDADFAAFTSALSDIPNAAAISTITKSDLSALKAANDTAAVRIAEIDTERANIATRAATVAAMKTQLQAQLDELNNANTQLESGEINMLFTVNDAAAQLTVAENKLSEAEAEFEAQRDAAYKNADLSGIITADTVKALISAQNFSMPAGSITEGGDSYAVKVGDAFSSLDEMKNSVLLSIDVDGLENIRLCDVADVEMTDNSGAIYAKINGNDGVMITIQKQSTYSTADVSKSIKSTIADLQAENPDLHITPLMDQGVYIDMVIQSVLQNLLYGGILAVLVLLIFLRDWRSTLIIGISIPISLMFAVVLMYFSNITLNIISLSGLALGVGMLVDNSIVSIENIYRLNALGCDKKTAAVMGAKQIAGAITASTLTTICVFLPIVFTDGLSRQLFVDMGLTIAYSLIASLIAALTLVPALASRMVNAASEKQHRIFDKIVDGYEKALNFCLNKKAIILVAALALFIYSVVATAFMGTELIPQSEGTQITATLTAPEGSLREDVDALGDKVLERIGEIEDIDTVGAMRGNGGISLMSSGGDLSFYILLKDDKAHSTYEIADMIKEKTADLNCTLDIQTSNMDMSMLGGSGISIEIKGKSLDTLAEISADIKEILKNTEGVTDISATGEDSQPQTQITVDKAKAAEYGLSVAQVYSQVATALSGDKSVTTLSTPSADYPVVMVNTLSEDITRENIKDLVITPSSANIPLDDNGEEITVYLHDIASVSQQPGLSSISHDNQSRIFTVSASVDEDHNIGLVGRDIQAKLDKYNLPDGYTVTLAGENESINSAISDLILMIVVAVAFIYLIMVAQFQSLLSPFIVMFTMPLAFTGGLLALQICGQSISILALLGFLILAGIVVNNGIVFVDYINQLRLEGTERRAAILRAGKDRIRPILMTAITTILGLSTMALGIGTGSDMMQPMAIVTVGGLLYATLLTLFVVPCIYDIFQRKDPKKVEIQDIDSLPTV